MKLTRKIARYLAAALIIAGGARAQMPHEVLVLANKNSQPSLLAANTFMAARQIPGCNLVRLDIPAGAYGGSATVTPEEFTRLIWEPANAVARERGIDRQILAWVYSVDFPIRVRTDASDRRQMSVGGLTFLRNRVIDLQMVEEGKYLSKLFSGPNARFNITLPALSLGMHRKGLGMNVKVPPEAAYLQGGLGDRMPLPSMMLGYIGEKGTGIQAVIDTIQRGMLSDCRGLRGGFYFVTSDDVRSKCRAGLFEPVVKDLAARNIQASVTTNFPAGAKNVMGVMAGAETVVPASIGSFAPGAMAEHLTSWSAEFQKPQTKLTEWIKAGATASAGTVVEPYSNPDKFPSAVFYSCYVSGCTMLESFYQSIACPLQILLIGEPLAKPYALPLQLKVLGADTLRKDFTFIAHAQCPAKDAQFIYSFLLDGREIRKPDSSPSVFVRVEGLADGYHELRAVVRVDHLVQFNASADRAFVVNRLGRSIAIEPDVVKRGAYEHAIRVKTGGTELPVKLRLMSGELLLDEKPFEPDAELILDEQLVGEGPNNVRVMAVYADEMAVSSAPFGFSIRFNQPSGGAVP